MYIFVHDFRYEIAKHTLLLHVKNVHLSDFFYFMRSSWFVHRLCYPFWKISQIQNRWQLFLVLITWYLRSTFIPMFLLARKHENIKPKRSTKLFRSHILSYLIKLVTIETQNIHWHYFFFECNISINRVCSGKSPDKCLLYRKSSPQMLANFISGNRSNTWLNLSLTLG